MSYRDALAFLEGRQETRWKLGLSRIEGLLGRLGDPQDAVPAVHVTGTNGKGTFCALLAAVLREAGLKTGLYTSPHLIEPVERIALDGRPVAREDFARLLAAVRAAETEQASYFELVTAAAFLAFREARADVAVVEVGLGGRLDATNALRRPALTVVTSIGLDHAPQLGSTHASVAREKAGILKPGAPFLCGEEAPEALAVLRERAYEVGAPMILPRPAFRVLAEDWEGGFQDVDFGGRVLRLGLLGAAAARNAALVLAAVDELKSRGWRVPEEAAARGFAAPAWRARLEPLRLAGGRTLVLDGAHNLPAMEAFAAAWRRSPWGGRPAPLIAAFLRDKDYEGMARVLAPLAGPVIAARAPSPRALEAGEVAAVLRSAGCAEVSAEPDPERALERWRRETAGAGAAVGSFYLAGKILEALEKAAV